MSNKKAKNLPEGITQRKDGRFMGRFCYSSERYTVYGDTLKDTKDKLEKLKYEVKNGIYAKEENLTVNAWFEIWIREYKEMSVKEGTVTVYSDNFKSYIKKSLGNRKLKDVRPEHIQKLYNDLFRMGYSKNTIELVSIVLSGMYKQALKNRIIKENPVPFATLPKMKGEKERRVMTREEQTCFLEYAKDSYLYDLILMALCTGLRSGELRGLEWRDIDFEKKTIHVRGTLVYYKRYFKDTPKTPTSKRDVPMLDNIYYLLKKRKKKQAEMKLMLGERWKTVEGLENLVFTTDNGYPLNRDRLKTEINKIIKCIEENGISFEHITPHTFRHTFATRCIEKGMKPQVLKAILGHSKLSMTMDLYSHVLPDAKMEEMQLIAELF